MRTKQENDDLRRGKRCFKEKKTVLFPNWRKSSGLLEKKIPITEEEILSIRRIKKS